MFMVISMPSSVVQNKEIKDGYSADVLNAQRGFGS